MHNEIVELFEKHQLEESLIAKECGVEEGVVVATLMTHSGVYRRLHERLDAKEDKTKEEYDELKARYQHLAFYAEDEAIQAKCLEFLINENRGRNDLGLKKLEQDRELAGAARPVVNNVTVFNMLLQKNREKKETIVVHQLEECTV